MDSSARGKSPPIQHNKYTLVFKNFSLQDDSFIDELRVYEGEWYKTDAILGELLLKYYSHRINP